MQKVCGCEMISIYFVNCSVGGVQLPVGTEHTVYHFRNVSGLLENVLNNRLANREHYESDLSIVVYDDNEQPLSIGRLRRLICDLMPCLNITVSTIKDWATTLHLALDHQKKIAADKLSSNRHWMYAEHKDCFSVSSPCSVNMYSMARQLAHLPSGENKEGTESVLSFLELVDPVDIIRVPHNSSHYWTLLDTWAFSAHSLDTCELIECARLIITKLCIDSGTPCLSKERLYLMLIHLECAYHQVNSFHNFRHAMDVMQATYQLCHLLKLDPKLSLALCISAIGHDVGHPGTNNKLFSAFGSPLAEQYDVSILENFHSDVFISILELHWPQFTTVANLSMIKEAIIATDMALHERYLYKLQTAGAENLKSNIPLLTSLVIKAADISNVSRPLLISAHWAVLLGYEFNDCVLLEKKLESLPVDIQKEALQPLETMPETLAEIVKKYPNIPKGQLFFIATFVEGLFAGLADKFQELRFLYDNIQKNKKFWLQQ